MRSRWSADLSAVRIPGLVANREPLAVVSIRTWTGQGCGMSRSAGPFEEPQPFATPLGNTQVRMSCSVGGMSWARCEVRVPRILFCHRLGCQDGSTNLDLVRAFPDGVVRGRGSSRGAPGSRGSRPPGTRSSVVDDQPKAPNGRIC